MQPVLRLKRHVTELLQQYHDDPNKAIEIMYSKLGELSTIIKEKEAVIAALKQTTVYSLGPQTQMVIDAGNQKVPTRDLSPAEKWKLKSEVAADGGIRMGDISEKEFWKRMKVELDSFVDKAKGGY
jgi:hypothetical protein